MQPTIRVSDFCEFENGAVKSVDFSKLYTLRRQAPSATGNLATLVKTRPGPEEAGLLRFAVSHPSGESLALMRRSELALVRPAARASKPASPDAPGERVLKLQPLPKRTYAVHKFTTALLSTGGDHLPKPRQIKVEIPYGLPRFVPVATLKALLGARCLDVFFRKSGERWEICPDDFEVDLQSPHRCKRRPVAAV